MNLKVSLEMKKEVTIYVSARGMAAHDNLRWCCILVAKSNGGLKSKVFQGFGEVNVIRTTIIAATEGLKKLKESCLVEIVTHQNFFVYCVNGDWKKKSNKDAWREFLDVASSHEIIARYANESDGDHYNELCHQYAKMKHSDKE